MWYLVLIWTYVFIILVYNAGQAAIDSLMPGVQTIDLTATKKNLPLNASKDGAMRCSVCKKKKLRTSFNPSATHWRVYRCKKCTRQEANRWYRNNLIQNRVAQSLRKMKVGLGATEARHILCAFGSRSALSGSTCQLTVRQWNKELPPSAVNLILLSGNDFLA